MLAGLAIVERWARWWATRRNSLRSNTDPRIGDLVVGLNPGRQAHLGQAASGFLSSNGRGNRQGYPTYCAHQFFENQFGVKR